jgi:hypothetical protein
MTISPLCAATNVANLIIGHRNVLEMQYAHTVPKAIKCINVKLRKESQRCVNCINYNTYNKTTQANVNHSSLDKNCSFYLAVLKKVHGEDGLLKWTIAQIAQRNETSMLSASQLKKTHTHKRKVTINNQQISLRCIQINLQHSRVATDNLMNLIQQDHIDIVFVQVSRSRHLRLMDVARQKLEFQKLRDFPFTLFCSRLSLADCLVCE